MKNLIQITTLMLLIALASCSSNSFSKRKYQKGVFREHSVRIKQDKSKAEETFFASKSELEIKELQKEPTLLESATIIQNDTLHTTVKDFKIDERRSEEKHLNKSVIIEQNKVIQHKVATKSRRKKKQGKTKLSKASKITGWISIAIITIIIGLLILFIFFYLNLIAILVLGILLALLLIANLILTLKATREIKYKTHTDYDEEVELRRSRLLNIIALILIGLILAGLIIGVLLYFFLSLFEVI